MGKSLARKDSRNWKRSEISLKTSLKVLWEKRVLIVIISLKDLIKSMWKSESLLPFPSYRPVRQKSLTLTGSEITNYAMNEIKNGNPFWAEYSSRGSLDERFAKCDKLYKEIKDRGYKSNEQLYKEGIIDNILYLLDDLALAWRSIIWVHRPARWFICHPLQFVSREDGLFFVANR